MSFIHPREINPMHPKVKTSLVNYFRLYYGTNSIENKLEYLFTNYKFAPVSEVYSENSYPIYSLTSENKLHFTD